MHTTFLSLGSNMGNKTDLLQQACQLLEQQVGAISQKSSLYESEPWGFSSPDWFVNQALKVETALTLLELLKTVKKIEKTLGRNDEQTEQKYASRLIDIDILFYDDEQIEMPELTVPHRHIAERRFVLLPLCEIAPALIHSRLQQSVSYLLEQCADKGIVTLLKKSF